MMLDTIGKRIRYLREKAGLTQSELATIAGVTNKAVSSWEQDAKEPRMGAIERIANHFGVRKSDIIDGSEYLTKQHVILTDDEKTIIDNYRLLSEDQQSNLSNYIKFLLTQK